MQSELLSNQQASNFKANIKTEPPRFGDMTDGVVLQVGDVAPDFSIRDTEGDLVSLSELNAAGKSVILYFYPRDNTPGCTRQACDFRDGRELLDAAGHVVLGVSKDSAASHRKFTDKHGLNFPLLLDEDLDLHTRYGVWRMKKNYGRSYMGAVRSTFVVGADGRLVWVGYNVRAKGHFARLTSELRMG